MVLLRSIVTVGSLTLVSRLFGFVRDILIAAVLGAGMLADVFFVAFKFPNLFRRLFAEGAFNMAFVPLFAGILEAEGEEAARRFADQALAVLLWTLFGFVIVVELAMPWLMMAFAPGFLDNPEKFGLAVELTRITFPYLLFISLVSLFAGVLNSVGKFAAAAATPILLNICLIGAVLGFAQAAETPGHALAWGVFTAGIVQFVWLMVHTSKAGFRPRWQRPRMNENVKLLLMRALPVALGAGIYQINLLIDTIIASLLPEGSISYLFFADRVNQLPLGVVGVAVGTALLPLLSRQIRADDEAAAASSQNRALEFSLLLTLPAAIALMVIAEPVVTVLFQRGAFGDIQAAATAAALGIYAIGLPAYVLVKALAPGFFARGDTSTPVKIAIAAMVVNLVLNLILMGPFLHVGIAMATAVSSWLNAGLMATVLYRRGHLVFDARLKSRAAKTLLASIGMGAALYFALPHLADRLGGAEVERAIGLAGLVAGGALVFAVLAQVTGAARIADVKSLYRGKAAS
ncbi:MAG: murein biosynthesis integral membrane protein MurJ [Rhodospirillaceae bacterium]|nr:murein biosynthesis integral membrane protein MurJ [Rhodospirillaceae bacterium]MBT5012962.1 murein biosynthesis integral membrane protein MurJ [Rhodospirillaceae bacterium]MBT5309003.1 murein biosynthesis integral membrane protein MurJ [Rhodospirillaceae bacterium]MBT6406356.1 murein biosynthesis integral membrane protein MurJ [Rhodospirillaceae bacterium]MBT7356501.1 murein biosynthesis integral membrane protein MurJ [Rhodospirillaceae bacterium]